MKYNNRRFYPNLGKPPAAVATKLEDEDDPPREKVVPIVKEETVK